MIVFLEQQNYCGNYYIQHFVNGVTTLEKLGHSFKELDSKTLSTPQINVQFRG